MAELRIVACPTCGKPVEWTPAAAWRPFCSERCKLIDLGAWAAERYRVVEDKDQPDALDPDGPDAAPGAPKST